MVIHQKNQGISASRNVALELATGDYIGFVDSDDVIHPQMYQWLTEAIEEIENGKGIPMEQIVAEMEET